MTKTQTLIAIPAIAATLLVGGALAGYATFASAQTGDSSQTAATSMKEGMREHGPRGMGGHGRGPGVMGKVTAVNGSTITVTDQREGTSYTVNAGSATVQKMTTGSIGDIAVGDTIGVHGDVSGTTVTAKSIMDDLPLPTKVPAKTQ